MVDIDRRTMLRSVAVSFLAASTLPAVAGIGSAFAAPPVGPVPRQGGGLPGQFPAPTVLSRLPGDGNQLALTIDDGTNPAVVAAFGQFYRDSGVPAHFLPQRRQRVMDRQRRAPAPDD